MLPQLILMMSALSWSQFDAVPLAVGEDCNNNGISDEEDLIPQNFGFEPSVPYFPEDVTVVESRDEKGRPIDFNDDGFPDLVVCGYDKNIVSVLLGRGDGTFSEALIADVDVQPFSMVVADFNRDGKLDVDNDGQINPADFGIVQSKFGCLVGSGDEWCDRSDVDKDCMVNPVDSGMVQQHYGELCP